MKKIRLLRADEIECRVSTVSEKGVTLLLYKDARVDQNILDELLDVFYRMDISIPPDIVTRELYNFYIPRVVKTAKERNRYRRKIYYLINKHQNVIVKTLDAPST